jgi:predicted MFS family arabinose efflux permease
MPISEETTDIKVSRAAWLALAVLFFAEVIVAVSEIKVPSLLPDILAEFGLALTAGGVVLAITGFVALVFALPCGPIDKKLGPWLAGLIALVIISCGAVLGAVAGTFVLLMASRVVEGIGGVLVKVVVPGIVARWFPKDRQGLAMGILSTATPFGAALTFVLVPVISAASESWRGGWWAVAAFSAVAVAIWAFFLRVPSENEGPHSEEHRSGDMAIPESRGLLVALGTREVWYVSLVFLCFAIVALCIVNFYPTFLNQERGMPLPEANRLTAIAAFVMIPGGPLCGLLMDKIGFRKVMLVGFALLAMVITTAFRAQGIAVFAVMVLLGVVSSGIPVACLVAMSAIMDKPERVAMGMAVLTLTISLGYLVQPLLFSFLVDSTGWATAAYIVTPFCLIGAFFAALIHADRNN